MVAQFGLEMMPLWFLISSALISGITSGTFGSILNAWELSTQTHPRLTALGSSSFACSSPAAPRTISTPSKASGVASRITICWPANSIVLPALRADARSTSSLIGKLRSSRHCIIWAPTTPVAPRIATTLPFGSKAIVTSKPFRHEQIRYK